MLKIRSNTLQKSLESLRRTSARKRRETLDAMGLGLVNMARRAFTNTGLRPKAWLPRKDSLSHPLLLKTGSLRNSLRVVAVTVNSVVVGSDRPYALIHQVGGTITPKQKKALVFRSGGETIIRKKVKIPPRPYFPFVNGYLTEPATRQMENIIRAKMGLPDK